MYSKVGMDIGVYKGTGIGRDDYGFSTIGIRRVVFLGTIIGMGRDDYTVQGEHKRNLHFQNDTKKQMRRT
jgi:hypothetical protein